MVTFEIDGFQSLIGKIQTPRPGKNPIIVAMFQSLIGKIQTAFATPWLACAYFVSIPNR